MREKGVLMGQEMALTRGGANPYVYPPCIALDWSRPTLARGASTLCSQYFMQSAQLAVYMITEPHRPRPRTSTPSNIHALARPHPLSANLCGPLLPHRSLESVYHTKMSAITHNSSLF